MSAVETAALFAALGDPARLHLVERLQGRLPLSITALTDGMGVTRQAVAKHLKVLEKAGLVRARKAGREQHFALCPDRLQAAERYLNEVGHKWDDALQRLAAHLEP